MIMFASDRHSELAGQVKGCWWGEKQYVGKGNLSVTLAPPSTKVLHVASV